MRLLLILITIITLIYVSACDTSIDTAPQLPQSPQDSVSSDSLPTQTPLPPEDDPLPTDSIDSSDTTPLDTIHPIPEDTLDPTPVDSLLDTLTSIIDSLITTDSLATGLPFSLRSLSGSWAVSQEGTYHETDTVHGASSPYYPYTSAPWDTSFTADAISMVNDTLKITGWIMTQSKLKIAFVGTGSGNSILLTGTRTNSITTPWTTESYRAQALSQLDGSITLLLSSVSSYATPSGVHGVGETSIATLRKKQ